MVLGLDKTSFNIVHTADNLSGAISVDERATLNCELINDAITDTGYHNNAFLFDGTNDYCEFADNAIWEDIADEGCISMWYKADTWANTAYPFLIGRRDAVDSIWSLNAVSNSYVNFFVNPAYGGTLSAIPTTSIPATGVWTNIIVIWNSTYGGLYLNGVLNASNGGGTLSSGDRNPGVALGDKIGGARSFDGMIDEVYIKNTVCTPSEIATLANDGFYDFPAPETPIVNASKYLIIRNGTNKKDLAWFDYNGNLALFGCVNFNDGTSQCSASTGEGFNPVDYWNMTKSELGWTNLTNYPDSCPAGTAVTTINDTITCTEFAPPSSSGKTTFRFRADGAKNVFEMKVS